MTCPERIGPRRTAFMRKEVTMNDVVIGIDIGTGSIKGILADLGGEVVAQTRRMHKTSFPRPGYAEHDADQIWWKDVIEICREFSDRIGRDGHRPAGPTISGIGPVFLPGPVEGQPRGGGDDADRRGDGAHRRHAPVPMR